MISWISVVWSMDAAACFTLAVIHLLVWSKNRDAKANLMFPVLSASLGTYRSGKAGSNMRPLFGLTGDDELLQA